MFFHFLWTFCENEYLEPLILNVNRIYQIIVNVLQKSFGRVMCQSEIHSLKLTPENQLDLKLKCQMSFSEVFAVSMKHTK